MDPPSASTKFMELLGTLPKQDYAGSPPVALYQYQGFWCSKNVLKGIIKLHDGRSPLRALPLDIILAGAPKTGNTWLKALSVAIATRNNSSPRTLQAGHGPHDLVPYLEMDNDLNSDFIRNPNHPLLSTHLPYAALPESILSSGCKIVYIYCEPKDVLVSALHFYQKIWNREYCLGLNDGDYHPLIDTKNVDLFCQGVYPWGPYWDHVLGYYKASLNNPGKIFLLKYEYLKRDTLFYVIKSL